MSRLRHVAKGGTTAALALLAYLIAVPLHEPLSRLLPRVRTSDAGIDIASGRWHVVFQVDATVPYAGVWVMPDGWPGFMAPFAVGVNSEFVWIQASADPERVNYVEVMRFKPDQCK